eukprot:SAG11_NODE_5235_length_1621_cov_1.958607_2_plen_169_part_00
MNAGANAAIQRAEAQAAAEAGLALQSTLADAAQAKADAQAASAKAAADEAAASAKQAQQALFDAEVARAILGDASCQYGGKGDLKMAHLQLTTDGRLFIKSRETKKPEPPLVVSIAECVVAMPKKAPKDFPHAILLRKGTVKEELKLVLGFGSFGEYAKWAAALSSAQ